MKKLSIEKNCLASRSQVGEQQSTAAQQTGKSIKLWDGGYLAEGNTEVIVLNCLTK